MESEELLFTYWNAVEALDADLVASLFLRHGSFFLNEHAAVRGRDAIRRGFVQLFAEVASIAHQPITLWSEVGLTVAEADMSVLLENGGAIHVPSTTVLCSKNYGIEACRFLFNPEPGLIRATQGFVRARVPVLALSTEAAGRPDRFSLRR